MPIPSQPTTNISLGPTLAPTNRSISSEFGDTSPHVLGDFYRGGPLVADHPVNSGVPTTIGGTRSLSQYNGSSIVLRYTISANTQNFNLLTYATSPSRVGTTKSQGYQNDGKYTANQPGYGIEVVINPGVVIGSATRTQNAFETGLDGPTGWNPDVKIVLKNQGQIIGAGGNGGATDFISSPAGAGQAGGTAVFAQRLITIQNAGTFAGGGGGGGGGGLGFNNQVFVGIAGGGGGGGAGSNTPPNTGGAGGASGSGAPYNGQAGTFTAGGNGGPVVVAPSPSGAGGRGGTITPTAQPLTGQSGSNGTGPPPSLGGAGGAAGFYIRGNANVTWQAAGTQTGQAQPT